MQGLSGLEAIAGQMQKVRGGGLREFKGFSATGFTARAGHCCAQKVELGCIGLQGESTLVGLRRFGSFTCGLGVSEFRVIF